MLLLLLLLLLLRRHNREICKLLLQIKSHLTLYHGSLHFKFLLLKKLCLILRISIHLIVKIWRHLMLLVASIRLWDRLLLLLLLLMRIKWNWFELCRLCGKSWINSFHIQLIKLRGYSRNLLLLHLEILRLVLLWLKLLALIVEHNNLWINNRHWLRTTSINLLLWWIAVE